jgi:hypothetical protein
MAWCVTETRSTPLEYGIGPAATEETDMSGVPRGVSEALADPIVQALMAADRVAPASVAALARWMAGQLAKKARSEEWLSEW